VNAASRLTRIAYPAASGNKPQACAIRTNNGFPGGCGTPSTCAAASYPHVSPNCVASASVNTHSTRAPRARRPASRYGGLTAVMRAGQQRGGPPHVYEPAPFPAPHTVARRDGPGHQATHQTLPDQIGGEAELVRVIARGGGEVDGTLPQFILDDLQHRQVGPHQVRAPEPARIERHRDGPEVAGGRLRERDIIRERVRGIAEIETAH